MDTTCKFCLIVYVLCLLSVDIFCAPGAMPGCSDGVCEGNDESSNARATGMSDKKCSVKCPCDEKNSQSSMCKKCLHCPTVDSTTPVKSTTRLPTTLGATTGKLMVTSSTTITSRFNVNDTEQPTTSSSTEGRNSSENNPLIGDNAENDDDKIFSKDFLIGMIVGALAVGIVVIATSITCFVCYTRNQRMRREIIESYEKRYEKDSGMDMVGNEAYTGVSLRGGFFSGSASTLRTSVSPDACYAEVEDDMPEKGKRISYCSLPDIMDKVVDPTSGYAFYRSDRPSVYSGFHGNNARAKNTNHGLHRIDRPTIYTGLKRDANNRQPEENLNERVYAEAKEVLPERVLKDNNNDKPGPSHTYMKINEEDPNDPSTATETRPTALPANLNQSDAVPGTASPFYFQVNNDNEKHHYQMLEKNEENKDEDNEESSVYQSLGENIPGGGSEDNRLPTYFILDK